MHSWVATILCLVVFAACLYAGPAPAADEDTQASVYLVFDPETGEFITVDDPSVTSQHAAQQTQEEIESVATAQAAGNATMGGLPMSWIIAAAIAALAIVAAFFRLRRSQQSAS